MYLYTYASIYLYISIYLYTLIKAVKNTTGHGERVKGVKGIVESYSPEIRRHLLNNSNHAMLRNGVFIDNKF